MTEDILRCFLLQCRGIRNALLPVAGVLSAGRLAETPLGVMGTEIHPLNRACREPVSEWKPGGTNVTKSEPKPRLFLGFGMN